MAPKAKVKAKAKAKARAKAKAKVAPRRRGRLGVPRVGGGGAPPVMHRPAARDRGAVPDPEVEWKAGQEIGSHLVQPHWMKAGDRVVITKGFYYGEEMKISGQVDNFEVLGEDRRMRIVVTGTSLDRILTWGSGMDRPTMRLHLCTPTCNREEVADDIIHAVMIRRGLREDQEEAWASNLQPVPTGRVDELPALRARGADLATEAVPRGEADKKKAKESDSSSGRSKRKKKKKRKKKDKEKRSKKEKEKETSKEGTEKKKKKAEDSESEDSIFNGRKAKAACKKELGVLYRGTGLDPRESVRRRVFRRARRQLKKQQKDSSSSSRSSSSTGDPDGLDMGEDGVFLQTSKIRRVGDMFPGALASQTLEGMKIHLLTEVGQEERSKGLSGICLPYYRQFLSRRTSGPQQRELLTLMSALDALMAGRPATAADIMIQRVKSCESVLTGSHWSVAQKLELVGLDTPTATPLPELSSAQRDVYEEAKTRASAAQSEGRPSSWGKGQGRGRGEQEGQRKGKSKEKGGGRGAGNKGDAKKGQEGNTGK